jgi:hypothetical protein
VTSEAARISADGTHVWVINPRLATVTGFPASGG